MTVEADIYTALTGLVGGRVFPDVAPLNTTQPYITYQQIGGKPINYVENTAPTLQHGFFQFNVWAASRAEAASLTKQLTDTLRASSAFTASPESEPIAQHEPDLGLYGTIQDFSLWSAR